MTSETIAAFSSHVAKHCLIQPQLTDTELSWLVDFQYTNDTCSHGCWSRVYSNLQWNKMCYECRRIFQLAKEKTKQTNQKPKSSRFSSTDKYQTGFFFFFFCQKKSGITHVWDYSKSHEVIFLLHSAAVEYLQQFCCQFWMLQFRKDVHYLEKCAEDQELSQIYKIERLRNV